MNFQLLAFIFWSAGAMLVYTYLIYPVLISLLAKLRREKRSSVSLDDGLPYVNVVLAAHNESRRIAERLNNLLACDYPPEKFDIVVVSDGSTDPTAEQVRALKSARIHLIEQPERLGKSQCLNFGVAAARGEIIVFCDTRQRFAPKTISKLVARFNDPKIGAVSGSLEIDSAASSVGRGIDAYWRMEKFLRFAESRFDSCIGCTGAVYAIRKNLFQPLPVDTLLDDVVIPMKIVEQGFRVVFEPEAVAYDPQTLEPEREKVRKRRTLAGNYQMLFRYGHWLLPWRNRLWWMLISHKYLRLVAPLLMLLMLLMNFLLVENSFYRALLWLQIVFYFCALFGLIFTSKRIRFFSIPAGFVFLNWMALSGLWHYFRQRPETAWEKPTHV
jgi:cellulose synthase/poly-beta-1,6-N-acetylglucosamine synthase-like glycosyltransferase